MNFKVKSKFALTLCVSLFTLCKPSQLLAFKLINATGETIACSLEINDESSSGIESLFNGKKWGVNLKNINCDIIESFVCCAYPTLDWSGYLTFTNENKNKTYKVLSCSDKDLEQDYYTNQLNKLSKGMKFEEVQEEALS
jgi:hypothetical protein